MKRKCYALLSLLLAVCMVLPMGVFVGADTPAQPKLSIAVSDYINTATGEQQTVPASDNVAITLAKNGTAQIKVTTPPGYTLQEPINGSKAVYSWSGTSSSLTIKGEKVGSDDLKFKAVNAKENKTVEGTLTVTVIEEAIRTFNVNVDVVNKNGTTKRTFKETGMTAADMRFNPGDEITVTSVDVFYNNGTEKTDSNTKNISPEKIVLVGGEEKIPYTYSDGITVPKEISFDVFVLGKTISKVDVSKSPTAKPYESGKDAYLEDNIVVNVTYSDNSSVTLASSGYVVSLYDSYGKPANKITKDTYQDLFFTISFDGYTHPAEGSPKLAVRDYVSYSTAVPKDITMTFGSNAKKNWVDGQILNDFNDVTVKITYENGDPKEYKNDTEIKSLGLDITPFSTKENTITVKYTEGDKTVSKVISLNGFTISPKAVENMEIKTYPQTTYAEGDKLKLDDLCITVTYNNGTKKDFKFTDKDFNSYFVATLTNGKVLSKSDTELYVIYDDGQVEKSVKIKLTVKEAGKKIIYANVTSGYTGKTEYFVGEKFNTADYRVDFVYNDGTTKRAVKLNDTTNVKITWYEFGEINSSTLTAFSRTASGNMKLTLKYDGSEVVLEIPITVTKRPNLKSISATFVKKDVKGYVDGYYVGDTPSVLDFNYNVLYDDGSSRTFPISESDSGYYKNTPYNYTKTDENKIVYYTLKLTPTRIEEDTKTIRIAYTERVTLNGSSTTNTVYTDVEIKVTVPDCILTHYESRSSRKFTTIPYESLYDALHDASDYDEIQLCRDVTLATDYDSSKTLEIDLNGHTLTMIRGEIYVRSNASSSTKITFSNSSRDDAHIRYTANEDDDIIIAYNKEYVIDRFSKNDGRYDITITSVKNGKVTGPTEVIHGHDAKFTITPDEGYEIAAIKVNNKTYKAASDNTLLIEDVREKLTVTVTFQEKAWQNPFTDVSKYATYYKAVQFVYEEGLFNGTSATKFEPDTTMTRAMFVTVLGRLAGVNVNNYKTSSFSDVATGQWYSEYVEWASSIGLVEGYGNGKFGPNDSITHAQMYVLMERYADIIEGKTTTASGTSISANDVRDIPDWAYEAVEYAAKNDFLVVSSYKLTPNDNAKRSELAMLLQKFCKNILGY